MESLADQLPPEIAHQIHPDAARPLERLPGEPAVVADRYPVLVQPVLEAPEPVRARADDARRFRRLLDLDVLAAQPRALRMSRPGITNERLRLGGGSIAVLGKEGRTARGSRREGNQRIAGHGGGRHPTWRTPAARRR